MQVQQLQRELKERQAEAHAQVQQTGNSGELSSKASAGSSRQLTVLQQYHAREIAHLKAEHDESMAQVQSQHKQLLAAMETQHAAKVEEVRAGMRGVAAAELAAAQKLHQQVQCCLAAMVQLHHCKMCSSVLMQTRLYA